VLGHDKVLSLQLQQQLPSTQIACAIHSVFPYIGGAAVVVVVVVVIVIVIVVLVVVVVVGGGGALSS